MTTKLRLETKLNLLLAWQRKVLSVSYKFNESLQVEIKRAIKRRNPIKYIRQDSEFRALIASRGRVTSL